MAITFTLVFGQLPLDAIIQIFLIGGGIDPVYLELFMKGYRENLWIAFATAGVSFVISLFLPNDLHRSTKYVFYLSDPEGHEVIEAKDSGSEESSAEEERV